MKVHLNNFCSQFFPDSINDLNWKIALRINQNTQMISIVKVPINRNGGCNHMLCNQCGCTFCWWCGNEIYEGQYYHQNCQIAETSVNKYFTSEEIPDLVIDENQISYPAKFKDYVKFEQNSAELINHYQNQFKKVLIHDEMNSQKADDVFRTLQHAKSIVKFSYAKLYFLENQLERLRQMIGFFGDQLFDLNQTFIEEILFQINEMFEKKQFFEFSQQKVKKKIEKLINLFQFETNPISKKFYEKYEKLRSDINSLLRNFDQTITQLFKPKYSEIIRNF